MPQQKVLVFETEIIKSIGEFQGYTPNVEKYLSVILSSGNNFFIPREQAENNPKYKQLIPYIILRFQDTVFKYKRGQDSDKRLIAKYSLGLGGHIEPLDRSRASSDRDLYIEAARREVNEEVLLDSPYCEHVVALINDDTNSVGRVHLGIVHIWDLAEPKVTMLEDATNQEIAQAEFTKIDSLKPMLDMFETWSQIALRILNDPHVPPYRSRGRDVEG